MPQLTWRSEAVLHCRVHLCDCHYRGREPISDSTSAIESPAPYTWYWRPLTTCTITMQLLGIWSSASYFIITFPISCILHSKINNLFWERVQYGDLYCIGKNFFMKFFCITKIAGLGKIFIQWKFSRTWYTVPSWKRAHYGILVHPPHVYSNMRPCVSGPWFMRTELQIVYIRSISNLPNSCKTKPN